MNPMHPPDELVLLTHKLFDKTGWYVPPSCWVLAAGVLFATGLLVAFRAICWAYRLDE